MIGKRCQFSQIARDRGLKGSRVQRGRRVKYAGWVKGQSECGKYWSVLWDGLRHRRLIEKVLIEAET